VRDSEEVIRIALYCRVRSDCPVMSIEVMSGLPRNFLAHTRLGPHLVDIGARATDRVAVAFDCRDCFFSYDLAFSHCDPSHVW